MTLSGWLMHKDAAIAKIDNFEITDVADVRLLPLYLKRGGALKAWVEDRVIDRHRPHSRLIRRMLRMSAAEDYEISLKVNAATITDNWWIKKDSEDISYTDVRFSVNYFDNLALLGDPDSIERINRAALLGSRSPELTNIGSFEKCWRLEEGAWWLYKQSNELQTFSELFIFEMGRLMGFNMAIFEPWAQGTKTLDFTGQGKYDFEPAFALVGEEIDYLINYKAIAGLSLEMARAYLDILACDALFFNFDRHTHNYGFLRDSVTGEYIAMAPNFDNNLALAANGYPSEALTARKNDIFINDFLDLLESIDVRYKLPELQEADMERVMDKIGMDVNRQRIKDFVLAGYTRLRESEYIL
ncbi:MAG: hypothetical protein Q4C55_08690 [Eubacterium sp.]|nr:hypothetical protein [Eubacterium sp.]